MPIVTEKLASDNMASTTDGITSSAALTGTADANSIVHFTIDGSAVSAAATANASGLWSFTPTGLADGTHSIVASETNSGGMTGAATLTFTLDTQAPIPTFTGGTAANGQAILTGTTGEANDTVTIYDGNSWLGTATTHADGTWNYTAAASSGSVHSYGANATNSTGSEGHGSSKLIIGSSAADNLAGTTGNDVIVGNGGNDQITGGAGADKLTGGSGNVTFVYNATTDSNFSSSDTVTDFRHGSDKIDFTNIAGLTAVNGVPQFQGNITGSGAVTLNAHSVAFMEVGGNTQVLVNTSGAAETITATDTHAADMKISLVGVNLGLTGSDFHHV
jgi:Ca2+-binding RTX toxin-like protein